MPICPQCNTREVEEWSSGSARRYCSGKCRFAAWRAGRITSQECGRDIDPYDDEVFSEQLLDLIEWSRSGPSGAEGHSDHEPDDMEAALEAVLLRTLEVKFVIDTNDLIERAAINSWWADRDLMLTAEERGDWAWRYETSEEEDATAAVEMLRGLDVLKRQST